MRPITAFKKRRPRSDRNLETPGEDGYLSGEYAASFVGGLQDSPLDPAHWQAGGTCKHFVANSMEHTTEVGVTHDRSSFDASVSVQDLVSDYLVPFQSCIEKATGSGLMWCAASSCQRWVLRSVCWLLLLLLRHDD